MQSISEQHTEVFFKEIERIEKDKDYFVKIGLLSEEMGGTNLIEFMTISDYVSKKIFLEKNLKSYLKYKKKITKIVDKAMNIWGMIPMAEDLLEQSTIIGTPEEFKMLVTYVSIADNKTDKYYAEKLHFIESHNFNWDDTINNLEGQLINEDSILETIIVFNNLWGDFQEFENEIRLAIKLNPELNEKLNQLENIIQGDDLDEINYN